MEAEQFDFSVVFPNIAAQLRSVLGNLHLAAAQLAPAIRREGDPALDSTASLLDQSYYRLLRLVNNLTAAGELGQDAPLPVRDRDLTETVRAVCAGAQGLFALKKVQLEFRSAADCHTCAFHQPSIELLLYQLLSNALKFTPAGGAVTVELKFINRWVRLSVSDTGCGIQEDQIPFLFDRYLHDDAMAPQPHGLGLGLPYLPAHRRAPRRHHDCRVPAGAGVPLHPVVAGPAMRDCGRVGREVRLQRRLQSAPPGPGGRLAPPGFLPAPSGLTLAPAGVGFFRRSGFPFSGNRLQ